MAVSARGVGTRPVWLARGWCLLLALVICAPMLPPGYVLSYDMVWVPHLDLARADVWGWGSALPRAVPSDAVVALLGVLVPAAAIQKAMLLGVFVAAGLGWHRMTADLPFAGRWLAVTFAIWNPFVVERLALGSWPVLVAYAGVPWLLAGLGGRASRGALVLGAAALAMSPATGLMSFLLVAVTARGVRQRLWSLVLVAGLNAPWIVAGLAHGHATVDPVSVRLFEAQGELGLGPFGAVLSLGGIWNIDVVPTSRTLWTTGLLVVVGWGLMLWGSRSWWRRDRRGFLTLGLLALLGLVVALAGVAAPDVVARFVSSVPGGGLVRDGTRWLLLTAGWQIMALGHGAAALVAVARPRIRQALALALVSLPIVSLPDAAWGVAGQLRAVSYPASWGMAAEVVRQNQGEGDLLVLPFTAYRQPSWNHDRPVLDPAGRYFARTTVVSDVLYVSGVAIGGEDPRAQRIGELLAGQWSEDDLAAEGIGLVLVDTTAGDLSENERRAVASLERLGGDELVVHAVRSPRQVEVDPLRRGVVMAAWITAGSALIAGLVLGRTGTRRRPMATGRTDTPDDHSGLA